MSEEAVEQLESVLDALEPVLHDSLEVVETVHGEVADAAIESVTRRLRPG